MATEKLVYTLRLHEHVYGKIKVIAEAERRSMAMQIELAVEQFIAEYEKQHGVIAVPKTSRADT
jgi:predicted transcriptional regulator